MTSGLSGTLGFSPIMDGHYVPARPYDPTATPLSAKVPLVVGANKDETLFLYRSNPEVLALDADGLRHLLEPVLGAHIDRELDVCRRNRPAATPAKLYIAITTAQLMGMDAITLAEWQAALGAAPVYMYVFAFEQDASRPGALTGTPHAAEIPFKFNHVQGEPSSRRVLAAKNMSKAWAACAATGNPSHDGIPQWPAYTLERRSTMFLDAECRIVDDPNREERLLWQELASGGQVERRSETRGGE